MEKHEFNLSKEIDVAGTKVSTLTWRDVVVRDMLVVSESAAGDIGQAIRMVANLCEIPILSVKQITGKDFRRIGKEIEANQQPGGEPHGFVVREPLAGDYEIMDKGLGDVRTMILLAEALTGVKFDELLEIRANRFNALTVEIKELLA